MMSSEGYFGFILVWVFWFCFWGFFLWLEVLHLKKTPVLLSWDIHSAVSVWITLYLNHCLIHVPSGGRSDPSGWSCPQWVTLLNTAGELVALLRHRPAVPAPQEQGVWELFSPLSSQIFQTHNQFEFFSQGKTLPSRYVKNSYVQATETSMYHWFPSFWAHNPWQVTDFCPLSRTRLAISEIH